MNVSILLLLICLVLFLIDLYAFQPVKVFCKSLPAYGSLSIKMAFWFTAGISYIGLLASHAIFVWMHSRHTLLVIFSLLLASYISKIILCIGAGLDDLRRGLIILIRKIRPARTAGPPAALRGISRSQFLANLALLLGGSFMATIIHGLSNRYKYHVRRIRLDFPNLPAAFRGLKAVQFSDLHTGSFDDPGKVQRGIDLILREKPDVIFFTGDLVNDRATEVLDVYKSMYAQIHAPLGVYATLGNHDYGDYVHWPSAEAKAQNLEAIKALEHSFGWTMLNNEHTILEKDGDQLAIIGVENWSALAHFKKYGDLKKAYTGVETVPFKILLSHDPSHWDAEVNRSYKDIDLTLSGHTHGMQFGVDIPGFKWSPIQYIYKEWAGLYKKGPQVIYVNRGFGFIGYPGRVGVMPEITVLHFA